MKFETWMKDEQKISLVHKEQEVCLEKCVLEKNLQLAVAALKPKIAQKTRKMKAKTHQNLDNDGKDNP